MVKKEKDTNGLLTELMEFVKKQFEVQGKILEDTAEEIRDLRQGQLDQEKRFDQLETAVRAVSRAVDKDAVKVIDHERRLTRIEVRSRR